MEIFSVCCFIKETVPYFFTQNEMSHHQKSYFSIKIRNTKILIPMNSCACGENSHHISTKTNRQSYQVFQMQDYGLQMKWFWGTHKIKSIFCIWQNTWKPTIHSANVQSYKVTMEHKFQLETRILLREEKSTCLHILPNTLAINNQH